MSEAHSQQTGLTRRELLKRGAVLGGAIAWSTPAVQLVGMQRAMAAHVSGRCICVKFDGSDNTASWTPVGRIGSRGTCLPALPTGCANFTPDSSFLVGSCSGAGPDTFCIQKNTNGSWDVYMPAYCGLAQVWAKCGNGCCQLHTTTTPALDGRNVWHIEPGDLCTCPASGGGQSHFEFCFDCT